MKSSISALRKECAIYTVLWQLYHFQNLLSLESIGQFLLLILIVYSLYRTIYVISKYRLGSFMTGLTLMFVMFSLYGGYHLLWGHERVIINAYSTLKIPTFYYLKYIYCSIPTVYVYYYFAQRGVFTPKIIIGYAWFFALSTMAGFIYFYFSFTGSYIEGLTNNVGYKFVPIMALAFLMPKWRMQTILFCYCFIVFSMKRGAILIGTLTLLIYLGVLVKTSRGFKKIGAVTLVLAILTLTSYSIIRFYTNSKAFQQRIEMTLEGNSSGRDRLAESIIDVLNEQFDEVAIIFGHGADATLDIAGNYAHNDWLEIIVNQGLLGVFVYFLFYVLWFKNSLSLRSRVPQLPSMAFGIALLGSFGSSIFSMAYTAFGPPISIVLGYTLYLYYNPEKAYA